MGQKVNPHGLRVGIIKDWDSHWFVDKKDFAANIKEDNEIRNALKKKYYQAAISKIAIEKAATKITINIFTAMRRNINVSRLELTQLVHGLKQTFRPSPLQRWEHLEGEWNAGLIVD